MYKANTDRARDKTDSNTVVTDFNILHAVMDTAFRLKINKEMMARTHCRPKEDVRSIPPICNPNNGRLRVEACKFETSLGYMVRICLKKKERERKGKHSIYPTAAIFP